MANARQFDVVVVGAGPAGAESAYQLARLGRRVLLLERARLPRDKPCGGGLTPKAYRSLDLPEHLVRARIATALLQHRGRARFQVRASSASIWMVCRREFDYFLVQRAAASGAEIRDGCALRGLEGTQSGGTIRVHTSHGPVMASAVVAADGAESLTARLVGLRPAGRLGAMVALEMEGPADSELGEQALLDYGLPGGYAWVFPKGGVYNVGLATYDRHLAPRLRELLGRFALAAGVHFRSAPRAVGHRIPTWGPAPMLERGAVMLAGDAAGLADPFFGEGIAYALLSGRLAARALDDQLANRGGDGVYTRLVRRAVERPRARLAALRHVVYRAPLVSLSALRLLPPARAAALGVVTGAGFDLASWELS